MDLSSLLSDLDHLPPFANEYNKQLDKEVKEQERRVRNLATQLEDVSSRMEVMGAHTRSIQQELQNTQNLHDARVREADTEKHLQLLAEREVGKLRVEIESMATTQSELKDKLNVIQNNIFKTTEKVEEFRQQMNWNKDQLEQWVMAEKQKEDDNMSLLRYTKADDVKIKEYNLAIDKLIKEGIKKKADLDAEITETRAAQIQLDKTGEAFKKLHQERQELIRQWEETIDAMKVRDEAIAAAEAAYVELKGEIGGRKEVLREKQKFLDEQKANNVQVEARIGYADRQLAKVRAQYSLVQSSIVEYQDEVETLRNTVGKTATTLETKKAEVLFLKKDILDKKARVERVKQVLQSTQAQLKNEFAKTDSLDARAKQLEAYHKQEESRNKTMDKELADLKQQLFKHSQEMFQLKQTEGNLLSEISGSSAAAKNLQSKIHKLDSESMKQMELVYNQEYQLQLLERKISRAQGERSNEEKAALAAKIHSLTKELEAGSQTVTLLSTQLKKVEDDVKAGRRRTEAAKKEKEKLDGRLHELVLDNDSAARSLKAVVKTKEELLIAENFVRLDVKRLRDILYRRADEVFSLGNRKLMLRMAMEERQQEISIHQDALKAQLRGLEDDKHSLVKELKEGEANVENLKKKYAMMLFRYAPQFEEGSMDRTQAYYVIRAAQEKEELQQIGDALDLEIVKSEKEIRGLVNTLQVLNAQNEKLHSHRSKPELSKEDSALQDKLEEEFSEAKRAYDARQREISELQGELNGLQQAMDQKVQYSSELNEQINLVASKKNQLDKDLGEQVAKFQRAKLQFIKLAKVYKQKKGLPDTQETVFEKELSLQDKREQINKQLYNIVQFAHRHQDFQTELHKLASSLALVLPDSPSSFSRMSARSSVSSSSSSPLPSMYHLPQSSPSPSPLPSLSAQKSMRSRPSSSHPSTPPPHSPVANSPVPSTPTCSQPSPNPLFFDKRHPSPSPSSPSTSRPSSSSSNKPTTPKLAQQTLPSSAHTQPPPNPLVFDKPPPSPSTTSPSPSRPSSSSFDKSTTPKGLSSRQKTPSSLQSSKASMSHPSSNSNMAITGMEIPHASKSTPSPTPPCIS